uniref:Peptidase A2 domain-containing protein n=1 Tax=Anopheles minimus TaxID=112268 RepID=A0A182VT93_9DIPT
MSTSESEESFHGFAEAGPEETMVVSIAKELALLKAERDSLLRCVARIEAFAKDPQGGSRELVIARAQRLEKCWESFQNITREVRRLSGPVNVEENDALFDMVDERVTVLMGRLKALEAAECSVKAESMTMKETQGSLKLPRITLPSFAASYQAAWSALVNRYANPYLQKKRHVNELLSWPKSKKISAGNVNALIEGFERHTKLLEQLGEEPKLWGVLLVQLLVTKLDDITQREWERTVEDSGNTDYTSLISFLRGQVKILEASNENKSEQRSVQPALSQSKVAVHVATGATAMKCVICSGDHIISKCNEFVNCSVKDRYKLVKSKRLCGNCLAPGHFKDKCVSKGRCRACTRNHHSLLHSWKPMQKEFGSGNIVSVSSSETCNTEPVKEAMITSVASPESLPARGRLSTAIVNIATNSGHVRAARALLDSGSQLNLLSQRNFNGNREFQEQQLF